MNEEAKEVKATPVLSFGDPKLEEAVEQAQEAVENVKIEIDDSDLTPEEKQAIDDFAKEIDLRNTQGIMQYGASARVSPTFAATAFSCSAVVFSTSRRIRQRSSHLTPDSQRISASSTRPSGDCSGSMLEIVPMI